MPSVSQGWSRTCTCIVQQLKRSTAAIATHELRCESEIIRDVPVVCMDMCGNLSRNEPNCVALWVLLADPALMAASRIRT